MNLIGRRRLRQGIKLHQLGIYHLAALRYVEAVQHGNEKTQMRAEEQMRILHQDSKPLSVVYISSPGEFVQVELSPDMLRTDVYEVGKLKALQFHCTVAIHTKSSAYYITPEGEAFWGPKIPEQLCRKFHPNSVGREAVETRFV